MAAQVCDAPGIAAGADPHPRSPRYKVTISEQMLVEGASYCVLYYVVTFIYFYQLLFMSILSMDGVDNNIDWTMLRPVAVKTWPQNQTYVV